MRRKFTVAIFIFSTILLVSGLSSCDKQKKVEEKKSEAVSFNPADIFPDLNPGPTTYTMPANSKGDPANGLKLFNNTQAGNCAACHCSESAVGCGNIGPDFTKYNVTLGKEQALTPEGKKVDKDDQWLYQRIADPRVTSPVTVMPPYLTTKMLSEEQVMDLVAYLNNLK